MITSQEPLLVLYSTIFFMSVDPLFCLNIIPHVYEPIRCLLCYCRSICPLGTIPSLPFVPGVHFFGQ